MSVVGATNPLVEFLLSDMDVKGNEYTLKLDSPWAK